MDAPCMMPWWHERQCAVYGGGQQVHPPWHERQTVCLWRGIMKKDSVSMEVHDAVTT